MSTYDKAFKAGMLKAERQKRVRDAAPQMLEALKMARLYVKAVEGQLPVPNIITKDVERCDAAIRAAEGD